jgi:hypothetical protein
MQGQRAHGRKQWRRYTSRLEPKADRRANASRTTSSRTMWITSSQQVATGDGHDYEAGHAKRTQPHPVRAHAQGVARDRSHEQRYHRCGDQAENEVEQLHAATIACPPMSAHPPFGTLAQGQEPGCTRREARG